MPEFRMKLFNVDYTIYTLGNMLNDLPTKYISTAALFEHSNSSHYS